MLINDANLNALFLTFNMRFANSVKTLGNDQTQWAKRVAMFETTNTEVVKFPWASRIPRLRKWVGDRILNNITSNQQEYTPERYEDTLEVDIDKLADDQYGVFGPVIDQLAAQALKWPTDLVIDVLKNAHTATAPHIGYDSKAFFATDHPTDWRTSSGSQQNYWSAGKALTADNYASVRTTMMSYLGEDGKPLGIRPSLLVVPPALESAAKRILFNELVPSSAGTASESNVNYKTADLMIANDLADNPTTWYLLDTGQAGLMPFMFIERQAPEFTQLNTMANEYTFRTNKILYGVKARGCAGIALWFLAAKASA